MEISTLKYRKAVFVIYTNSNLKQAQWTVLVATAMLTSTALCLLISGGWINDFVGRDVQTIHTDCTESRQCVHSLNKSNMCPYSGNFLLENRRLANSSLPYGLKEIIYSHSLQKTSRPSHGGSRKRRQIPVLISTRRSVKVIRTD